jgi:hypothetical protein
MLVSVSVAYGNYEGNNAISLDGTDDYVHVGGISELGITGDGGTFKYTVEGWFMLKAGNEGERRCLWESEEYTIACEINADSLIHYNVNSTISGSEGYLNHVTANLLMAPILVRSVIISTWVPIEMLVDSFLANWMKCEFGRLPVRSKRFKIICIKRLLAWKMV